MQKLALLGLSLFALGACTPGPDYTLPSLPLPESWLGAAKDSTPQPPASAQDSAVRWWHGFGDDTLNQLITQGLSNNKDLAQAEARLLEARAARDAATARLLPRVDASGSAGRGNSGISSANRSVNIYEAGFDASWELDVFGGNRRLREAATAQQEAREAALADVERSLVAELVRNYIELRNAEAQMRITEQNIGSQRAVLSLTQERLQAGLVSRLDVAQAESLTRTTEARLPRLRALRDAARHRLTTLTGQLPGALDALLGEEKPVPRLTQPALYSLPAAVIAQRPDVREAERELAAATALQGAALAEYYPKLSLAALLGRQNTSSLPSTTLWSAASSASLPLIDFGRIRAQVDQADSRATQALAGYEQRVLLALEEVETALSAYSHELDRQQSLADAASAAEASVAITDERYRRGLSAFLEVLTAQQARDEAKIALAESDAQLAKSAVALHKALGGDVSLPREQNAPAKAAE